MWLRMVKIYVGACSELRALFSNKYYSNEPPSVPPWMFSPILAGEGGGTLCILGGYFRVKRVGMTVRNPRKLP